MVHVKVVYMQRNTKTMKENLYWVQELEQLFLLVLQRDVARTWSCLLWVLYSKPVRLLAGPPLTEKSQAKAKFEVILLTLRHI